MAFYSYEGLRNGATFKLDTTTATAIKDDPKAIVGKVVALVDNYTVGYGTSGDNPLGFVEQVEVESNSNNQQYVVSVVFNQSREDISCAGTESAGDFLAVDGSGGVVTSGTSSAAKPSNAIAWGVDTTAKTCTVYIRG